MLQYPPCLQQLDSGTTKCNMHVWECACACVCAYVSIRIPTCTCTCICMHMCTCMCYMYMYVCHTFITSRRGRGGGGGGTKNVTKRDARRGRESCCDTIACCSPMRTNWNSVFPERFLPPPVPEASDRSHRSLCRSMAKDSNFVYN